MGKPLTRDGAVPLLEEAMHLLRRTSLSTLVCHLVGTAPFALALLLFWNDATNSRTPDANIAIESMVLTLLLTWMNCWRAVFAGRLLRQLSGVAESPWTWRRIWYLLSVQSFLGATKLVVMPVAVMIVFPMAWVVSFYRTATALADREDLDPTQVIVRARQLAGLQIGQSWAVLPILLFLQLVLAINLALTLGLLPQLVRILTGYESEFSRSGMYFIFNPLFLISVLAVSWIAFDPYVQAVYCVRCFRGESVRTGQDVRAGLRSLTVAGMLLLCLLLPLRSFANVAPAQLEQSIRQQVQSHSYDWRLPPPPESQRVPWLVRVTDRVVDGLRSVGHAIGKVWQRFWDWLNKRFGSTPSTGEGGNPTAGLHWSIYALIALVILVTVWLGWRRGWFRRAVPLAPSTATAGAISLDADDLTADRLPEEKWIELGVQCLAENNLRLGLRAFYLANLAWLGRLEYLTIQAGRTNREFEVELRRKARSRPDAQKLFAANVVAFERVWYGLHEVTAADIAEFRARVDGMKAMLDVRREVAA